MTANEITGASVPVPGTVLLSLLPTLIVQLFVETLVTVQV